MLVESHLYGRYYAISLYGIN